MCLWCPPLLPRHTQTFILTQIHTHTHTPQRLGTGCRKLSSTSLEGRPLVKELPEGVCVLKFFGGRELIVCFQSHYYDRLFTERGRLQLLSALLLVPQYKQPQQHDLLFLMKRTSFLSTYLQHSLHHTLELLASLKATWNVLMSAVVCPVLAYFLLNQEGKKSNTTLVLYHTHHIIPILFNTPPPPKIY